MKQYKAVIFDFDMTLADTAKVIATLLNECGQSFGYPPKSFEELYPYIGNTHEVMLSALTGETNKETILRMRTRYRQLCREKMASMTRLFPDVPPMIRTLHRQGLKLGLLSLKLRDVLVQSLDAYGLTSAFDCIAGCEDVPAPKPDPSGLRYVLSSLSCAPRDALYVGDSLVDEGAAKGAGTDFAAMLRGSTPKSRFDADFAVGWYPDATSFLADLEKQDLSAGRIQ